MPRRIVIAWWFAFCSAAILMSPGCSQTSLIAEKLDVVADSVDRYGFASISTPFLVGPNQGFEFGLHKSAAEYFDLALKPQGAVRNLSSAALDVQLAFRMNLEQAISAYAQLQQARSIADVRQAKIKATNQLAALNALMAAKPALADQSPELVAGTKGLLTAISQQPEPDKEALPGFTPTATAPAAHPPISAADRIALNAVGPTFSPAWSLTEGAVNLSSNEAILLSQRDSVTQSLLNWFINPVRNKQADYELFFCPILVSVQPGTETRRGYMADITLTVDLARAKGDSLEYLSDYFPHSSPPIQVSAVFPAVDSQILDLANSRRQLFTMAIQLALTGFGSEANAFIDYAKKLEQDAKTRTSLTVASSYTMGSTCFGFRVEPKFVASADPTRIETEPGEILESKTFPAMAIVLVHRSYLHRKDDAAEKGPRVGGRDGEKKLRHQRVIGDSGSYTAVSAERRGDPGVFDYLTFRTSVRWAPTKGGPATWHFSEQDAWRRAEAMDEAERLLTEETKELEKAQQAAQHRSRIDVLSSRLLALRKLSLDSQALVRVWDTCTGDVTVEKVLPAHGWWDQYTVLTLQGRGFTDNIDAVTVGGVNCYFADVNDSNLLVLVPPWGHTRKLAPGLAEGAGQSGPVGPATKPADYPEKPDDVITAEIMLASSHQIDWHTDARVVFDRRLASKSESIATPGKEPAEAVGGLFFSRDGQGRITGVTTGADATVGIDLLRALAGALRNDPQFSLDLRAIGSAHNLAEPGASSQPGGR